MFAGRHRPVRSTRDAARDDTSMVIGSRDCVDAVEENLSSCSPIASSSGVIEYGEAFSFRKSSAMDCGNVISLFRNFNVAKRRSTFRASDCLPIILSFLLLLLNRTVEGREARAVLRIDFEEATMDSTFFFGSISWNDCQQNSKYPCLNCFSLQS